MKKIVSPPSQLADIATLIAIAENILGVLEFAEPNEPRIWKRALTKRNKAREEKTYYRRYCSRYNGKKQSGVYLGSCMQQSI